MKNEYGKKDYQKDYQGKGYQATNPGKENRNPNAPTQGGFSKTGGDLGQKNKFQQGNKPTTPGQSNNSWGTGSIKTDKNKDNR